MKLATLIMAATLSMAAAALDAQTASQRPPNIVVIVSDDMGYADIGDPACRSRDTGSAICH